VISTKPGARTVLAGDPDGPLRTNAKAIKAEQNPDDKHLIAARTPS
jgi:hypothetical protein